MAAPVRPLTSARNPRIQHALKLRKRAARRQHGLTLVEGLREVRRAIAACSPLSVFYHEAQLEAYGGTDLLSRCEEAGAELVACSESLMARLCYGERSEGIVAVCPYRPQTLDDATSLDPTFVVVVESVEKPGNLGAMLRTCDAAGVDAVLVCNGCTDVSNPNTIRASLGTLFNLCVIECPSEAAAAWLAERGLRIVAATPAGERPYTAADFRIPCAIVVGSEADGLSETWMDAADERLHIPLLGQGDSLNVSVATAVMIYEVVRQRAASTIHPL